MPDKYVNQITQKLTLSAANTITFDEVNLGLSLFDKVGLLIQRIEYHFSSSSIIEMTATGDEIEAGITTSNSLANLEPHESAVVHKCSQRRLDCGTAASAHFFHMPWVFDFAEMTGQGMLVAPRPLYYVGVSSGLASAMNVWIRTFFVVIPLKPEEYFELLETRHYFG